MKLIKMIYDRSSDSVRQCLVDRQDLHRNIQQFFDTSRAESKILYRLTKEGIYVSSLKDPITSERNGISVVAVKDMVYPNTGDVLRYNLFTRPYKKREGHRIPLSDEQSRKEWLRHQGEKHGFECLSVIENGSGLVRSESKKFEIEGHYYSGILRVNDKEKFSIVIESGIGAEKSYGLGMLLVV